MYEKSVSLGMAKLSPKDCRLLKTLLDGSLDGVVKTGWIHVCQHPAKQDNYAVLYMGAGECPVCELTFRAEEDRAFIKEQHGEHSRRKGETLLDFMKRRKEERANGETLEANEGSEGTKPAESAE